MSFIDNLFDNLGQNLPMLCDEMSGGKTYLGFTRRAVLTYARAYYPQHATVINRIATPAMSKELTAIFSLATRANASEFFSDYFANEWFVVIKDQVFLLTDKPAYVGEGVEFRYHPERVMKSFKYPDGGSLNGSAFFSAEDVVDFMRLKDLMRGSSLGDGLLAQYAAVLGGKDISKILDHNNFLAVDSDGGMFAYIKAPRLIPSEHSGHWVVRDESITDDEFTQVTNTSFSTLLSEKWRDTLIHTSDLKTYLDDKVKPEKEDLPALPGSVSVDDNLGQLREDVLAAEADLRKAFARITQVYSETGNIRAALLKSLEDFLI